MKTRLTVILAILAIVCWAGTASASLLDVYYDLTDFNVSGYTGPFVQVHVVINDSGDTATITETGLSNGAYDYWIHGKQAVGFNFTSNVTGVTAPANYNLSTTPPPPQQMDGYGTFNTVYDDTNANFPGTQGPITFTVAGSFTSDITTLFLGNGLDNFLCVRLGVTTGSNPTDFIETGFADSALESPPTGVVPLPPSALLLGSGLFGLGLLGWRRKMT